MDNWFCDATLVCEDKQIKAHKVIISSCMKTARTELKIKKKSLKTFDKRL